MDQRATAETFAVRLAAFDRTCVRAGLKITRQRREVYREVAGTIAHPDAETIWRHVRERLPRISLDTVYRALASLEEVGLVSRVGALANSYRFDANTEKHNHFVCTRCGQIRDLVAQETGAIKEPPIETEWGTVYSMHTELRGVCRDCRSRA